MDALNLDLDYIQMGLDHSNIDHLFLQLYRMMVQYLMVGYTSVVELACYYIPGMRLYRYYCFELYPNSDLNVSMNNLILLDGISHFEFVVADE